MSCGRRPAAFGRALGMAGGDVDPGDGVGGGGDLRRGGERERGQLLGMRGFGGERVRAGLDHPARFLVQLGRIEADHAGERLAVGEAAVRRHQLVGMPGAKLRHDSRARHCGGSSARRCRWRRGSALRAPRSRGGRSTRRRAARRARRHSLRRYSRPWTSRSAAKRPARATAGRPARRGRRAAAAECRAAPAGRARSRARASSAAAAARPSRSSARSRGLPRPAASRASARAKSGIALSAAADALAPDRVLVQPVRPARAAPRSRAGRSAARQCPRTAGAGRRRSGSGRSRRAGCRRRCRRPSASSSRLSRVAASIAMWLRAGDPARRVEQDAGALLRRVEIGEQAAGGGKLGARRRAEPVERRQAEATPSARARPSGCRTRPCPPTLRIPGTGASAIVSAGDRRASSAASSPGPQATSSNRPVEMSAAAIAQSSPARPIAASQLADADSSRVSSVRVPGVTRRTMARSTSALEPRALRASAGLSVCSAMATRLPRLDQPREIGFGGVDRDSAHRDRLAGIRAALGQRDVEAGRGDLGIVEEQFEEIAHAIEQQGIAGLVLEAPVLGHHRGRGVGAGHGSVVAVRQRAIELRIRPSA